MAPAQPKHDPSMTPASSFLPRYPLRGLTFLYGVIDEGSQSVADGHVPAPAPEVAE